jgi:hypothetical protein
MQTASQRLVFAAPLKRKSILFMWLTDTRLWEYEYMKANPYSREFRWQTTN